MKASIFNVLDKINRQGLDNQYYGFYDFTDFFRSAQVVFGTTEDMQMMGKYLYIYGSDEDLNTFTQCLTTRQYNIMNLRDSEEKILLVKL